MANITSENIIAIKGIRKCFDDFVAVEDFNLEVKKESL